MGIIEICQASENLTGPSADGHVQADITLFGNKLTKLTVRNIDHDNGRISTSWYV